MANGPGGPQVVIPGAGWVDVASRVVVQVGFPIVVAGVLLWFVLGKFQETMVTIVNRMAANTEAAAKLVETETKTLDELQTQTGELRAQTVAIQQLVELKRRDLERQK